MENLILKCPNCNKDINLNELFNKNKDKFNEIFSEKWDLYKRNNMQKIAQENEKELELKIFQVKNKLAEENLEYLNKIKKDLLQKEQELEIIKANFEKDKELAISKLKIAISEENNKKENEWNFKLQNIIKEYQEKISILEIDKIKNNVLSSKFKGENFENYVQQELNKVFTNVNDIIEKANHSIENTKPDFIHNVRNSNKEIAGKIIYEVKDAVWKNTWEDKLQSDLMKNNGDYGILVANETYKHYNVPFLQSSKYDNIWICDSQSFVFIAQMIRLVLISKYSNQKEINRLKTLALSNQDGNKNKEIENLIENYQKKSKEIEFFWTLEAPKALLICRKELNNIDSVTKTLQTQITKLEKAKERIQKQLENKIVKNLETILGNIHFNEFEEDEDDKSM